MVLELFNRLIGHAPDDIDRTRLQSGHTRRRFRNDAKRHTVKLRKALLEVVRILDELEPVAGRPGLELEGTCTDRMGRELVELVLRHDAQLSVREDVGEACIRNIEVELDR